MWFLKKNKVNFFIVGAQKCGTSALDFYLRKHPQIQMPLHKKELHFFDNEDIFDKKKIDYRKLEQNFNLYQNKIFGEITPIYLYWNNAIKRIKNYNPYAKIIVILRNPVERAFSQYNMEIYKGKENLSFYDAITNEESRIKDINSISSQHRVYSYKARGLYFQQLLSLYKYFSNEQVLVLKYEEFSKDYKRVLENIFTFFRCSTRICSQN